jgi:hypothetical protein
VFFLGFAASLGPPGPDLLTRLEAGGKLKEKEVGISSNDRYHTMVQNDWSPHFFLGHPRLTTQMVPIPRRLGMIPRYPK